jgi:hypothetical protein
MNKKLKQLWATKNKDDEWWSSFVTSPLAIVFNYFVVDITWLTPNLITLFSFIVALISVVFILIGGFTNFIIAAVLIHLSHILDCMDGQMARYRRVSSKAGCYLDKVTDQIQVTLWFGAMGYAAYIQSQNVLPVFLAFIGVAFYNLRGYSKYVTFHTEISDPKEYLKKLSKKVSLTRKKKKDTAGIGHGFLANLKWFISEQRKIFDFDEGVFIFMLSFALLFDLIIPILWIFAISQIYYGLYRSWKRGIKLYRNQKITLKK